MHTELPPEFSDVSLIGAGGMGAVYRAKHNGRAVAVKIPTNDYERKQLQRDAKALENLDHPNLGKIYFVEQFPSVGQIIVMELLEGGSLRDRMDEFRNPVAALRIVEAINQGLIYLHSRGFIHRDLKPENVLFDAQGVIRVVDFGLIKRFGQNLPDTSAVTSVGSPEYASPEMRGRLGPQALTIKTDVYSLGIILFELLTGKRPPIEGDWRPGRGNRVVHGSIDQVALGCLQEEPTRRPDTRTLEHWLAGCHTGRYPSISPGTPDYPRVHVGRHILKMVRIIGGDAHTRYTHPHGVQIQDRNVAFVVPDEIREVTEDWLKDRVVEKKGVPFENRDQPRLEGVGCGFTDDSSETLYPLILTIGKTSYFDMQITNLSIDALLPDRTSIRSKYGGRINAIESSWLANPLAVNLSVVTSDDYICVAERGNLVGTNPIFENDEACRVPAVSGTGHPKYDTDADGRFCIFRAAKREAEEEVLGSGNATLSDITLFGVARTTFYFFPFVFGEIRTSQTLSELRARLPRHVNDVLRIHGRPFTISEVSEWIKLLATRPISHTAAWSLYQSLIYRFPEQIDEINSLL